MTASKEQLALVTNEPSEADKKTRGERIKRRRLGHGIKSVHELHRQSGVSREAITAAEAGDASDQTYERLEAWLDRFDEETGHEERAEVVREEDVLEMSLTIAALGIEASVKGPAAHPEVIREQLLDLVRGVMRETRNGN